MLIATSCDVLLLPVCPPFSEWQLVLCLQSLTDPRRASFQSVWPFAGYEDGSNNFQAPYASHSVVSLGAFPSDLEQGEDSALPTCTTIVLQV